jgi:hypothetical protein
VIVFRQMMALVDQDKIFGNIEREGAAALGGWCWSSERPNDHLTVDILFDDVIVATTAAAAFRRDLASEGKGDGRHAFTLTLNDDTEPSVTQLNQAGIVELRHAGTGKIISRFRQRRPGETNAEDERLAALERSLVDLDRMAGVSVWPGRDAHVRTALAQLGDRLLGRAEARVQPMEDMATPDQEVMVEALVRLRRALAPVRLPIVSRPVLSVAVYPLDAALAHRASAAFASSSVARRTELLIGDDAHDPDTALLGTIVTNLSLVRCAPGFASFANACATAARADWIAILDRGSEDDLALLSDDRPWFSQALGEMWVDSRVIQVAACLGVADLLGEVRAHPASGPGMLLVIQRQVFETVGGLDPLFDAAGCDDGVLSTLDLCLRALMSGHRLAVVSDPERRPAPSPFCGTREQQTRFQRRWR